MKNIAKILLLGLLTVGMTTGCDLERFANPTSRGGNDSSAKNADSSDNGGNNYGDDSSFNDGGSSSVNNGGNNSENNGSSSSTSSGGDSGNSGSSDSGNNNTPGWTTDEVALMSAHLYGEVLPYTGSSESVVDYDAEYDMITITGGDVDIDEYQTALLASAYELVGEDEGVYAVEKPVSTSAGTRFVYVYVEDDEDDGFSLQAFDPYYYSWPTEAIAAFFEDYEATSFDVPTIDAEGAYFAFQEDPYNIWYLVLEMEDYVSANLVAYECSQSDFTTYYNKLDAAGWELEEQTSEGETYYVCTLNIENVGVARMELYYSASYEAISLTIYAYMSAPDIVPGTTYTSWPAIQIATMLGSSVNDTVPEYTGTNNGFQLLDDYYGMAVVVLVDKGTEEAGAAAYVAALPTAGYVLDGKTAIGDDRYVSPNEEIYVSVFPAATPGTITIYFEAAEPEQGSAAWPTSKVASAVSNLDSTITDVVPALEGADSYNVFEETDSVQVQAVYSSSSAAQAAKASYDTTLKTANFTEGGKDKYGDMNYNSPNEQFYINLWYSSTSGYKVIIDIYAGKFEPAEAITEWPADEIAAFMTNNGYTDVLPAFPEFNNVLVEDDGYELYIILDVDNPDDGVDEYADILEEAGFIFDSYDDSDGSPYYWSPNEQYLVNPYVSMGGNLVIWVA